MKLKRKQVYIDEVSDSKLKSLAATTRTAEAEHIRRALKLYLSRKAISVHKDDPLLKLIGLCDKLTGPKDASTHHDQYLYGKKVNK